jgi:S-adenosylmethionine hydrolase
VKVDPPPVITLLTDFGSADYFVAAVKGVILTINPRVSIVDITHETPPQDIESAAFTLLACYRDFPRGTIHMSVVDPGVGSARRAIAVRAGAYFFIGPDNGLFSYILDREPSHKVFHVTAETHFRQPLSQSFHGRDVFAPVAAAISRGTKPEELGPQITDAVRFPPLTPIKHDATLHGRVIHIDHFGNCVTNLTPADVVESTKLLVNGRVINSFRKFFGEEQKEELFAIWGSAGFLELSINGGSAAAVLNAKRGDAVIVSV